MKSLFLLIILLRINTALGTEMLTSSNEVILMRCSNLHRLMDPHFQQGAEVYLHWQWNPSTNLSSLQFKSLEKTESFIASTYHITRPNFSWVSFTAFSKAGDPRLIRFSYMGSTNWGGYFDQNGTLGEELMCQETSNFQKFVNSNL